MSAACVRVIHGANDGTFDLEGATVDRVRRSLVDAFNVPEDAIAFVNGEQVDPANYRLACQDTLEFCRQAGVKGAGKKNFTEDDLNKLGFAIVGDQAVPIEDAFPDDFYAELRANWPDSSAFKPLAETGRVSKGSYPERFVLQGVHMILDGDHQRPWQEGEKRVSRLVFIGRNLPEEKLRTGFESCVA